MCDVERDPALLELNIAPPPPRPDAHEQVRRESMRERDRGEHGTEEKARHFAFTGTGTGGTRGPVPLPVTPSNRHAPPRVLFSDDVEMRSVTLLLVDDALDER